MSDLTKRLCTYFLSLRASGLIAALAFTICLGAAASASAAIYTVTNSGDSGPGSLRAAIAAANASPIPDEIIFRSGLSCDPFNGVCTISLTSGELAITSAATSGGLTITNTFYNPGSVFISGSNTSRVFY